MTLLAIDTSVGPCSVAVWKDGRVSAYLENLKPSQQSACLMPMIAEVMVQAGVNYSHLNAVACTIGPGSFTGIRVGLAAARGICFAGNIKPLGFTTLEVVAFASNGQPTLSLLNAGKGEVYFQAFNGAALYEPRLGKYEEALATLPLATIAGNMEVPVAAHMKSPITFPRADLLAALAAKEFASAKPLHPFYIREPDAKPMAVDR